MSPRTRSKSAPRSKEPCDNPIRIEWKEEAGAKDSKKSGGQENPIELSRSAAVFEKMNEEGLPDTVTSSSTSTVGRSADSIKKRTTASSPSPGPSTSSSKGVVEQKFSSRGRLLKSNTVQYSPDPDNSANSRDKCITTPKSSCIPESTAEEDNEVVEEPSPVTPAVDDVPISPAIHVEVPSWRIIEIEGCGDEPNGPIPVDDMSDEAYLKRHQKPEVKEKRQKRWDSQRLREEDYMEKLRMTQSERELKKELRNQQKTPKRRADSTSDEEQEILMPTIDDVKAIFVSQELPDDVVEYALPLVEKDRSSSNIPFFDLDTNSARMNLSSVNVSKDKNKRGISSFTDSRICSNTIDAGNGIVVEFEDVGECGSPASIFTIDVVDFRSENADSNGSSRGSSSSKTNFSVDNDAFNRSSSLHPVLLLFSLQPQFLLYLGTIVKIVGAVM
ncbi:unnamed protein product [Orchesella dallaii]|uniref:PEHE domain-containing protein n=1 Tax=Orchesella dallaii TaxID=48710 RepID=A0ABP1QZ87_9HEXA